MFEIKKITLDDNGVAKTFSITPLAAIPALKLLRSITLLLTNTDLIQSVVYRQFIEDVMQTGMKLDIADEDKSKIDKEREELLSMNAQAIITYLIQSIIGGLDDKSLESLIYKCFSTITYHNGAIEIRSGEDVLRCEMIKDYMVILKLVHEVFILNFSGAIDRLKKLVSRKQTGEKTNNT